MSTTQTYSIVGSVLVALLGLLLLYLGSQRTKG